MIIIKSDFYQILNGIDIKHISINKEDPGAPSDYDTDALTSESDADIASNLPQEKRVTFYYYHQQIKIFDRYTMILQIFAKRA